MKLARDVAFSHLRDVGMGNTEAGANCGGLASAILADRKAVMIELSIAGLLQHEYGCVSQRHSYGGSVGPKGEQCTCCYAKKLDEIQETGNNNA